MRSDDYLEGVLYIPDDRSRLTPHVYRYTYLFEQAVIHIYNGKSVKKVYYDPPFGMDIASLVFYNFFCLS